MKATGIVRRLDDLGRLVIPKEIRKIYKLKEGDSIEFFVSENNEIIIRKYEHLSDHNNDIRKMIDIFQEQFKKTLIFYGDDQLITESESLKRMNLTEECIYRIKTYHEENYPQIRLFKEDDSLYSISVFPLVLDSHWVGSFIFIDDSLPENMRSVIISFIRLLTRQISE